MKKRTKITLAALFAAYLILCGIWGAVETALSNGCSPESPSYSLRSSAKRGALISPVRFSPNRIDWKGRPITIGSAWLERRARLTGLLVVIPMFLEYPFYKLTEGYNLCFTLAEGHNLFFRMRSPFFVLDHQGGSFGAIGTVVFYQEMNETNWTELTVNVTDNWQFSNSVPLKVSW